jgi:hypothetical protein
LNPARSAEYTLSFLARIGGGLDRAAWAAQTRLRPFVACQAACRGRKKKSLENLLRTCKISSSESSFQREPQRKKKTEPQRE